MIDSEQIIIWPEKKGKTKRPSNLNMLHIWFGTILMIYLIVWLFFISFHFHLFRATYGTLDRILSVSLLWSNELFTSDLFYVNLLTFRCNQAYRVDDAVHSLESTYLLWCILFRLFAAHNSIVHIFSFECRNFTPNQLYWRAHIVWIWFAWMPKWKSVLWYRCSCFFLFLLLCDKTNVFHAGVKNG